MKSCEPAFTLCERLGRIAAASGKVDKDMFMANTLKETSGGVGRSNAMSARRGIKSECLPARSCALGGHEHKDGLQ